MVVGLSLTVWEAASTALNGDSPIDAVGDGDLIGPAMGEAASASP